MNAALCLARRKYNELPLLLRRHQSNFGEDYCGNVDKNKLLSQISHEHFLEEKFINLVMEALEN